jgi:HNH endonuclease
MHFYRHYRHGDVHYVRKAKVERRIDRRYVLLRMPGHPLAHDNWVYEHRLVLYEQLGPGPQECWWCGVEIRWDDGLQVDHLDHDRSNNAPWNLVPTCQPCNQGRGNGCDPEAWAIALASRRVLRRHADEFQREVELMRQRLEAVPYDGGPPARNAQVAQARKAALASYEEAITGRRRGR